LPLWVFAYGSLIWDPGFAVAERAVARAPGWHRSFCMRSIHHRGSEAAPGLVLALDAAPGAECHGLALRVAPGQEEVTLADLRARELISSAYLERHLAITLSDGREVQALAYVIDPDHAQYCRLDLETQAGIIATARGGRGRNRDYLTATAGHLHDLGIGDADLDWLVARMALLPAD
jgi:glutathione-specific gamma-glutamylcyclotransferase